MQYSLAGLDFGHAQADAVRNVASALHPHTNLLAALHTILESNCEREGVNAGSDKNHLASTLVWYGLDHFQAGFARAGELDARHSYARADHFPLQRQRMTSRHPLRRSQQLDLVERSAQWGTAHGQPPQRRWYLPTSVSIEEESQESRKKLR